MVIDSNRRHGTRNSIIDQSSSSSSLLLRQPLLLLLLFTLSAVVCPSSGQLAPSRTDGAVFLPDAAASDDSSVAAIVDAPPPVEVAPAALTAVDGSTDERPMDNDDRWIGTVERAKALSSSAAARTWTKRLKYAATHLATPSGGGGSGTAMQPMPTIDTEKRRKPARDDQQQQQQQQQPLWGRHRMTQEADDEHGRRRTEEAEDESDDIGEAGTARLVAVEDVDRDDLPSPAAADTTTKASSAADPATDDSSLTVASTAAPSSTASFDASPQPPIDSIDAFPPPIDQSLLSTLSPPPSSTRLSTSAFDLPTLPMVNDGSTANEDPNTTTTTTPSSPQGTADDDNSSSSSVLSSLSPNPATAPRVVMPKLSKDQTSMWTSRDAQQQPKESGAGGGGSTHAMGEFDLKSDRDLAKLMRRTTMRMHDYPTEVPINTIGTTTSNPLVAAAQLAASQAPSLFPGFLSGGPFAPPPPPSSYSAVAAQSSSPSRAQQPRRHSPLRADQFEQLGCGWDLMTLSCKDVFRVGWCESCADFGSHFLHDCRCTAVTGLYVQTASFLGSSAASARANAALTANQTAGGGNGGTAAAGGGQLPVLPMLPLLPTLAQLGTPLEAAGGINAGTALPRAATAELQQQLLLANALHLPFQPVPIVPVPGAGLGGFAVPIGGQTTFQQQQQQQQHQSRQQWGDVMTPILLAPSTASDPTSSRQQQQQQHQQQRAALGDDRRILTHTPGAMNKWKCCGAEKEAQKKEFYYCALFVES
uniref:RING-type domain-containing protein n=1 Tax=Globodera pallida TaxID=36090 RepID=A0A183C722_GLOPA